VEPVMEIILSDGRYVGHVGSTQVGRLEIATSEITIPLAGSRA
jgi:hypothetical protein